MKLLWIRVIVFGLLDVPYRMLILNSADVENEVSPDEDILENGFTRQVTFYEKD